ncbi:MAG: hypothetical protein QXR84_07120 [Candidatus Bathyarchaeia archaeon]
MIYRREEDMYPHIKSWLERELKNNIRGVERIHVYITPRTSITKLLLNERLTPHFSNEYLTYDIKVDITGIIIRGGRGELVFVECKLGKISLREFSQLLGYSVVAKPKYSLILSPMGVSDSLRKLISSFGRTDIIEYSKGRKIALAKWDGNKMDIDRTTIIPPGWSF